VAFLDKKDRLIGAEGDFRLIKIQFQKQKTNNSKKKGINGASDDVT
jgi:hypothetical protein